LPIEVSIKELLEAGVHFGHQTRRWNPKMKEFIFGERNGIYIVDLQKTHRLLQEALQFVQDLAAQGKTILFVGTKRQAKEAVAEEAVRCGMPYVNERWLGGQLTNFVTVRKSLDRWKELETVSADGRAEGLTKKELARLEKERFKLERNLKGIRGMKSAPDAVFVIDTRKEAIAVQEARKLKVVVVGIVDTNCDPDEVDYPVPGNDDALRAIRLFASHVADAVLAGRGLREARAADMPSAERPAAPETDRTRARPARPVAATARTAPPVATPAVAPVAMPDATPAAAPVATPDATPAAAPFATPDATPTPTA
jgi:small subunit ribosomal protein S2